MRKNIENEFKKIQIAVTGLGERVHLLEEKLSNRFEQPVVPTEAEPTNGDWVSVNDKRPDEGEQVLSFFDYGDHTDISVYEWDRWFRSNCITHWMKLPKPPSCEA